MLSEGIGVVVKNTCGTWQRVSVGLVGGPPAVTLAIGKGQNATQLLCDAPWNCGYAENWGAPTTHWLVADVVTQQRRIEETLTASSTGAMSANFIIHLC